MDRLAFGIGDLFRNLVHEIHSFLPAYSPNVCLHAYVHVPSNGRP